MRSRRPGPKWLLAGAGSTLVVALALAVASAYPTGSPLQPGRAEGTDLWSALFLSACGIAFALYSVALVLARRTTHLVLVCAVAAAIQLVPLAGPLLLSRDVYSYWDYGRLEAIHGANPYATPPDRYPQDPAYGATAWRKTRTVYGPAFTAASAGIARPIGGSPARAAWAYRLAGALGMLALTALAVVLARRRALAAIAVGWNPLLALHFAGGGHNDVLMMVLVLGALALERRWAPAAGGAWALAAGLKWIPLGLLSLRLLAARGKRRALALGFLAGASLVAGGAFALYGAGWLTALVPLAHRRSAFSIPSRLTELGISRPLAVASTLLLLALGTAWLAREAWRGRARLGLAAALVLLASPWLLPWYAVWAVPLAAVEEDGAALLLAVALSGYLIPSRVPL